MYEASNVHLNDYTGENGTQTLTCTDEKLRHINEVPEDPVTETIVIDEISDIRRDTDTSQTGFTLLGGAFGVFALVFSFMAAPFVAAGMVVNPIAGGAALSAVLCWYGAVMVYRMEQDPLDVLEIRADTEWYRFYMKQEETAFDEVLARLPADNMNRSPTTE